MADALLTVVCGTARNAAVNMLLSVLRTRRSPEEELFDEGPYPHCTSRILYASKR